MKIIEYYQFIQWEGGDRHYPTDPCFFTRADANAFLDGNPYDRFEKKTVYIYESVDEYNEAKGEEIKKTALAKLTDVEKKALGLI